MGRAFRLARAGAAALLATTALACTYAPRIDEPLVFGDTFSDNNFNSFSGANGGAVSVDTSVKRTGSASLRIAVPSTGYAGGALVATSPRDLSGYNALTFWARADYPTASFAALGLGNDNTGNSKYPVQLSNVPVGADWQKFIVPMPLPAKMSFESGLMFFSAVSATGAGYNIWIDDAQYELLDASVLGAAVPHFQTGALMHNTGDPPFSINTGSDANTQASYDLINFPVTVAGTTNDVTVSVTPAYLTFQSSNPDVVEVDASGFATAVGGGFDPAGNPLDLGTATISASLGAVMSHDTLTINVKVEQPPNVAAPTPDTAVHPASRVISLYNSGGTYPDRSGTLWRTFGPSEVTETDYTVPGTTHIVKQYGMLNYVGVDFTAIANTTQMMTHVHVDVWTPNGTVFGVKFGKAGSASTECELDYNGSTIKQNKWVSLDASLACLKSVDPDGTISELVWVDILPNNAAEHGTFFIDNVYFWK